jgi:hypothetical protein
MADKIICHAHCPRGGHGGGGWPWLVLAAVVFVLLRAAAHAMAPAIADAVHTAVRVAEILAATVAALAGLAGLGWLIVRTRDRREAPATVTAQMHRAPAAVRATAAHTAPREEAGRYPPVTAADLASCPPGNAPRWPLKGHARGRERHPGLARWPSLGGRFATVARGNPALAGSCGG